MVGRPTQLEVEITTQNLTHVQVEVVISKEVKTYKFHACFTENTENCVVEVEVVENRNHHKCK